MNGFAREKSFEIFHGRPIDAVDGLFAIEGYMRRENDIGSGQQRFIVHERLQIANALR
jgi:hypothetical protein